MDYTIVELPEQHIIGITTRTSNEAPDCPEKIGGLWKSFMGDQLFKSIPTIIRDPYECYGLYYDYDFNTMEYNTMVGCAANEVIAPLGMEVITAPAGKYAKFSVTGDHVQAVIKAWEEIWAMDLPRAFTVDFEAYLPTEDMGNGQIDLYIALK